MSRTKGAKNLPKELDVELRKLAQLYKDRGVDFPLHDPELDAQSADADPGGAHESPGPGVDDPLTFDVGDHGSDHKTARALECGKCGAGLDKEYPRCPYCNTPLTWGA